MRFTLIVLVLLIFSFESYSQKKDFFTDTLFLHSGKEHYRGRSDLSGKVKISSTGDKIQIEVEVKDDKTVVKSDGLLSDRIEIWYALPDEKNSTGEKRNSSSVYYSSHNSSRNDSASYRFYSINSSTVAKPDSLQKKEIYFGQVHYGVYPDNRKVQMFDSENYQLLEKVLGEKPGHVIQGISYKAAPTKSGYKYTISITPLGLGFIQVPEMKNLRMMVDVIDVDIPNEVSIWSTSEDRQEGNSYTYNSIEFSKPLKTNVTSIPLDIFTSLNYSPIVMFNNKGYWSGVVSESACTNDSCELTETKFFRTPFGYKKWETNKMEIRKLTRNPRMYPEPYLILGGKEEIYFVGEKRYVSYRALGGTDWNFKNLNQEFILPDGSQGLLLVDVNWQHSDSCGTRLTKEMHIVKITKKEEVKLFHLAQDDCRQETYLNGQLKGSLKIEKVYWAKEGSILMIEGRIPEVGTKKFRVTFGKGDKVEITEVKK